MSVILNNLLRGLLIYFFTCSISFAAGTNKSLKDTTREDSSDFLKALNYPELEVVPLASERLKNEYKEEKKTVWLNYLPIQIASVATLYAGISSKDKFEGDSSELYKNNNKWSTQVATLAGLGWLSFTIFLQNTYTPYKDSYLKVKKLNGQSNKDKLAKERWAEEGLYNAGTTGLRMRVVASLTQFISSAYVVSYTDDESAKVSAILASLVSLTPLFFSTRWEYVANKHKEYKKKIYGPLGSLIPTRTLTQEVGFVPGLQFAMDF